MVFDFEDNADLQPQLTLPMPISAIEVESNAVGGTRLSPVSRLPRGARVKPCGRGTSPNTVRVVCEGKIYFVFEQELAAVS